MFTEQGACASFGTDAARNRKLLNSAAQASARQVANVAIMQPSLGREQQMVLRDPYKPLTAVARVPGLNAWPKRKLRDPRYYGFGGLPKGSLSPVRVTPRVFNGFAGFGFLLPTEDIAGTLSRITPRGGSGWVEGTPTSSGPGILQSILDTIRVTLPATVSAVKGQPYYNPGQVQSSYQTAPYTAGAGSNIGAQLGTSVGGIGDTISRIVQENPLLVLGGGLALVLLMMKPPSRR